MKKTIFNFFVLTAFGLLTTSCKSDKKEDSKNNVEQTEQTEQTSEQQESGVFVIDTGTSALNWKGSKPMGEHIGSIDIQSGEISFQNGTPQNGKVVIDMNSIVVKDEGLPEEKKTMLANHLKGTAEGKEEDFFNTPQYPTAVFEITGNSKNGKNTMLQGNLTIKDKTHPVSIPVRVSWSQNKSSVKLISEKFSIDRTKWGVNYGSKSVFDNLGDNWISDKIELDFAVKASKK